MPMIVIHNDILFILVGLMVSLMKIPLSASVVSGVVKVSCIQVRQVP